MEKLCFNNEKKPQAASDSKNEEAASSPAPKKLEKKETSEDPSEEQKRPANYKTVLCKWYEQGGKCYNKNCTYAHGQKELVFRRSYYNKNKDSGTAGDEEEDEYYDEEDYNQEEYNEEQEQPYSPSTPFPNFTKFDRTKHPKYKTEMCRNIKLKGECHYDNCTFAHSLTELRKLPPGFE